MTPPQPQDRIEALDTRIAAIEARLEEIEKLLQMLVNATPPAIGHWLHK